MRFPSVLSAFVSGLGFASLSLPALAAPPENDAFADAVTLTGNFDVEAGTSVDATRQGGERTETEFATSWYKWTAPSTGRARFSALPTGVAPINRIRLTLWLGNDFGSLVFLGAVQSYTTEALMADLPVVAGTQYHICVGSYDDNDYDEGTFDCSVVLQTIGDLSGRNIVAVSGTNTIFSLATELSGVNATAISYGLEAPMREAGEPAVNPNYSSWWKWTAPANGYGRVSLAGTNAGNYYTRYDQRTMAVYRVTSFSELTTASPLAVSAVPFDLPADLTFPVIANQVYFITAGQGRLTGGGFISGDQDSTPWKVLTVQYSATSPAVLAKIAALNAQIAAVKQALKRAKAAKKKRFLRKKIAMLQRQLRATR